MFDSHYPLINPLKDMDNYNELLENLRKSNKTVSVSGLVDAAKPHMIYGASSHIQKPIFVITNSENRVRQLLYDFKFLYGEDNVGNYPAQDVLFYGADVHSADITVERMLLLDDFANNKNKIIITSVDSLISKIMPKQMFIDNVIEFAVGDIIDIENLAGKLVKLGYERTSLVESVGQFAIRGGIIDIHSLNSNWVYRIELWDDEVDSIRTVNPYSQRSVDKIDSVRILPVVEWIEQDSTKYEKTTILDYIAKDTIIVIDEPVKTRQKAESICLEFEKSITSRLENEEVVDKEHTIFSYDEILIMLNNYSKLIVSNLEPSLDDFIIDYKTSFRVYENNTFFNNFNLLEENLKKWKSKKEKVLIFGGTKSRSKRLAQELEDRDIICTYTENLQDSILNGQIIITSGALYKGFVYEEINFIVVSDKDVFVKEKKKRKKTKKYKGSKIDSFVELKVGDYVVHENHGIGVFNGIEQMVIDNVSKDYLKIGYADNGSLYIDINQMDMIQKYIGAEGKKPKLSKLGGKEWKRAKSRVQKATKELAKELIELYAKREAAKGFVYSPDTPWQKEFEDTFPYQETDDQLQAIEDVKADMESSKVMDRLLCGDVGYGKTEVALRAAFKAVQDGKQVVYLVPTTILAQQHYNRFVERMRGFPINIELLSRFRTPKQTKQAIEGLKTGMVDIVIGTHRVLSKDVKFKDLGLVMVDEEQRFGVTHKEKLKTLTSNVDVLTLTATPIPRTLHMSLVGIRDMSVLEDPPLERIPIQTYVMEHNPEFIRDAISRELSRDGQVYYLYNRVEKIDQVAMQIQQMVPEATVSFAHGQMSERELENIMIDFIEGEIDVLVCTTIIETGLDIANTNTIIIQDADKMGLSQLYQLRGRVGRSDKIAYAYLMYKKDRVLPEIAEKRLQAIKQFTQFGSGFKIAMRDLEIRGAGNLLGGQQHGHMNSIGYDLYTKLLTEAVRTQKGEVVEERFETSVDVEIDAYIPDWYIEDEVQKLEIYKKISLIQDQNHYNDIQEEIEDRYGDIPKSAQNLLDVALIKSMANNLGFISVTAKNQQVIFVFKEDANIDTTKLPEFLNEYNGKLKFTASTNPYFTLFRVNEKGNNLLSYIKNILQDMNKLKYE